ncbi:MAG: tRNA (guanosine(37)-N1)-methyltransferase TrmD [Clostridia bacterium]
MRLDILTLFPEMFTPIKASILARAQEKKLIEINVLNIRDFTLDKNGRCDDTPYGGGAGMVMTAQPIFDAVKSVKDDDSYVIFTSPRGKKFDSFDVKRLSGKKHLIIVCGHYEGIDERAYDTCCDEEISIGDYVLTGGELPAMVICDAICRYVPEVLNIKSLEEESFTNGLLEYPQFTKPQEFMGLSVPDVLLSGHHKNIEEWRKEQAIKITKERRKDLISKK